MNYRRAPAIAGALLLFAVLVVLISPESRLAVVDDTGSWHLVAESLTVRYRHSVQRTIVEEDFLPGPSGVRVVETRFSSFGAGLPSQAEWGGTFDSDSAGGLAVRGMTASFPEVRVRVGYVSEQAAIANGTSVLLASLVPPGEVLTIKVVTRPRSAWWFMR